MSAESSPSIIKYTDGGNVFYSAGGVWKYCSKLRSCEARVSIHMVCVNGWIRAHIACTDLFNVFYQTFSLRFFYDLLSNGKYVTFKYNYCQSLLAWTKCNEICLIVYWVFSIEDFRFASKNCHKMYFIRRCQI